RRTGGWLPSSRLERVTRVELRHDLVDRRLVDVNVLHVVPRRDGGDESVCRRLPRIERQLYRAPGPLADLRAGDVEVGDILGELHTQATFAEDVPPQRGEGSVGQDASVPDHDDTLGQRLDIVHVVRRENHRHASIAIQRSHKIANGQLRYGIETDRRLVEEEQPRTVKHARGDLAPHPLAERELAYRRREQALEIEQGDQFVEIAPVILRRHAIYVAQQHEAVGDREVPPKLRALSEHGADTRHVP